jgi:Sec-independent protein secretion pathway component TatC
MFPFVFPTGSLPDELGLFVPLALVIGVFAVLLVGRGGGDDRGARYVGVISLVTLFVALFAAFVAASALTDLVVNHHERAAIQNKIDKEGGPPATPLSPGFVPGGQVTSLGNEVPFTYNYSSNNNVNYNVAVASGFAAMTAGAVFLYHRRRRREIVSARGYASSPAATVNRTYLQSVKAVAVLAFALAAAAALYGIWQIIAPGISGAIDEDIGRTEGISTFLASGTLAAATALIFVRANNELGRT